jgi:hypothetical protein
MSNVDRRLERIEKMLGAPGCTCGGNPVLIIFEDEGGERRVPPDGKETCPAHGPLAVVRFTGSDIDR